jgi:Aldehyde dehydrogenase family
MLPAELLGPLAFEAQRDKVASYVGLGVSEGATVLTGGDGPDTGLGGYFFEPTMLTDVDNSMRVVREEIFGPVAAIMPFETEKEVFRLANDSSYGLAAGIRPAPREPQAEASARPSWRPSMRARARSDWSWRQCLHRWRSGLAAGWSRLVKSSGTTSGLQCTGALF